jgi:hypothetical protein
LEPGTREVNAIVAVPAHLREIEVAATVNWVPIDNPGKPMFTFAEAHAFHKKAVEVEKEWYKDSDNSQWQDWGVMTGRIIALQHRVPLQRFIVRLPYDHTSSLLASIQDEGQASLAPAVVDVVPTQGPEDAETDVFVTGSNFDINSTRLIVGGQEVPDGHVKLMSRRLIKAKLPKATRSASTVDLYVATPWGRSNAYSFTYLPAKAPADSPRPVTARVQTRTLEVAGPDDVRPAQIVIRLSGAKRGASTKPGDSRIAILDSKGGVILLEATYQATVVEKTQIDQVVGNPATDSAFIQKVVSLAPGEISSIKTYLLVNGVQEEVPVSGTLIVAKR